MPDVNRNPSINRGLKDQSFNQIDHALGRPLYPLRETNRNFFGTSDDTLAASFIESGHWNDHGTRFEERVFSVNADGRAALAAHLKEIKDPHRGFFVSFDLNGARHEDFVVAKSAAAAKWDTVEALRDSCQNYRPQEFFKTARVQVADPQRAVPAGRKAPGDGFWPMETPRKPFETISVRGKDGEIYAGLCDTPKRGIIDPITNLEAAPVIGEMTGWSYDEGPQP
jgi:hypothetical protein